MDIGFSGTIAARLRVKIDTRAGPDACHPFTGALDEQGYGMISRGRRGQGMAKAHVVAWELVHGPVPDGLVLDHVKARGCTMRNCCNLAHLALVTPRENTLRGDGLSAVRSRQSHCIRGHAFTPENTYHPPSRPQTRRCRACKAAWRRERKGL